MHKQLIKNTLFIFILVLFSSFATANVFINEFMPNSIDTDHEWIELYNNGTSSVNLNSWNISEESASKNFTLQNIAIPANSFIVLARNATIFNQTYESSGKTIIEYRSTPSLRLNDGDDSIFLYNSTGKLYDSIMHYADPGENISIGRFVDGNSNIYNLTVPTPGGKNDKEPPVLNRLVLPSDNDTRIAGIYNITLNITDLVYEVNTTIITINDTNFSMAKSDKLFYYLWNTSKNLDQSYNLTVYYNDSLGLSDSYKIVNITVDNTNPKIFSPDIIDRNRRGFIFPGAVFNASVNATDQNGIMNITCTLNGNTVGHFSSDSTKFYCNLTAPTTQSDYNITFTAYDYAGNTNTTTIAFTTKYSTSANLIIPDITVDNLNQSDKIISANVIFNNTGSYILYTPNIILDDFSTLISATATNVTNITCSENLSSDQLCNATFYITISGGQSSGTYNVFWNANWTDNNYTYHKFSQAKTSQITITSNPELTIPKNKTATVPHGTSTGILYDINSTGNADLSGITITYNAGTLPASWISLNKTSISSIAAGTSNKEANVTITIPKYTAPGNYTGNITISSSATETKKILLVIQVPTDSSWTTYPRAITVFKKTSDAGLIGTVFINNSGNINQTFTITATGDLWTYVWGTSNPTSKSVSKGSIEALSFYHKADGPQTSYTSTVTFTSSETSETNNTLFNLTRDDAAPGISTTTPSGNAYVKEIIDFNVSASDLNLSRIEFYIGSNMVFNDTNLTKSYSWNTTQYPDSLYLLEAIAYDSAGNYNISQINVTVNNSDNAPSLLQDIPTQVWNEENHTLLNLSKYFETIDGDTLRYNYSVSSNITISINNATGIANLSSDTDFFGTRYVIFYAIDSSNNMTPSNNVTLTVNNINDAPLAPVLLIPSNGSLVFTADGSVKLNWSKAVDADLDTLTYHIFYGNDSNNLAEATTQNTFLTLSGLNNASTYYWKVYSDDGTNNSANSTQFNFKVTYDGAPVINSFIPANSTSTIEENSTLEFSVNATDPDNGPLNYSWYVDYSLNKTYGTMFNYTPNFTASGTHTVSVNITDNNSNSVAQIWTITVSNKNRAPVLAAISNYNAIEDSSIKFNITATDEDNNTLSYTSNISNMTITKIDNNIATVSWTPANNFVGNNTINFTVSDGSGQDSQIVIITVTNVNDAPVINSFSPTNLTPSISETDGTQNFSINVTDPDYSDTLSYNWTKDNITFSTSSSYSASNLSSGTYNITVVVKDTNNSTAMKSWILTVTNTIYSSRYDGTIESYSTDNQSVSGVTITHANGSIEFNESINLSGIRNLDNNVEIYRGVVSINSDNLPGLNKSAKITMNNLNYSKTPLIYINSAFNTVSGGTLCNTTSWCTQISYNPTTGVLTFYVPQFSTYYTQENTTNGAPVITSSAITTARAGEAYSYTITATDPDSDTLTYSLSTSPSGMTISSSTVSWTPTTSQTGAHNVTIIVSDGSLTDNQSYIINVSPPRKLRITDFDVKVDGRSSKNLADGNKITRDAGPDSEVEFSIEVSNYFTDEEDLDIEDITVEVRIKDIDDGDDLEEESNEFDLRQGRNKDVKLDFRLPVMIDTGTYDVEVHVEGTDENNTKHEIDWTVYLEVDKERHEITIVKANLIPSIISCQDSTTLDTRIINTGRNDEDEVIIEITSPELDINIIKEDLELDEGSSEDSEYSKSFILKIPKDANVGTYPIMVKTYYDTTEESDSKTIDLQITECVRKVVEQEEPQVEEPEVIVKQQPTTTTTATTQPVKEESFTESPAYIALLALMVTVMTAVLALLIGITIIKAAKK